MSLLSQVADYLTTWSNWEGSGYNTGLFTQLKEQLELSAVAVVVASLTGVSLGAWLGHRGRGGFLAVNGSNAARAIPSLALLTLLAIQPVFANASLGYLAVAVITMWALAVPPVLTNAYTGVREVQAPVRSAAEAMGMSGPQVLYKVELPLAMPLIMAGVRTAAVEIVATATLAAYVGVNDLGSAIFQGLNTQDDAEAFSGALLVAVLALLVDQLLAWAGRAFVPSGRPAPPKRLLYRKGPVGVPALGQF